MSIIESIRSAFKSLWVNKIRSFLTILGVVIGVTSVISLTSIGEGVRKEFSSSIKSLGTNLVVVLPGKVDTTSGVSFGTSMVGINTLTNDDINSIKAVSHVNEVGALSLVGGVVNYQGKPLPGAIVAGITPDLFTITNYELIKGRIFNEQDLAKKNPVLVISDKVSQNLFGSEDPLGKKLTIFKKDLEIIGVAKWGLEQLSSTGNANTTEQEMFSQMIGMPISVAWEITKAEQIHRVLISVDEANNVQSTADEIKAVLLKNHDNNEDFSVLTEKDILDLFDKIFSMLTKAITGIAAISLIVGGIGIMNIMLVSVTERTKEIGIRKALGASGKNILLQFLIESSVLSLFGGLLGVLFAYGISFLVTHYADIPTLITYQALGLAFGVSVVVGIIFGIAPATKAARKNPIDALRYE